jgi:hypothetical protein
MTDRQPNNEFLCISALIQASHLNARDGLPLPRLTEPLACFLAGMPPEAVPGITHALTLATGLERDEVEQHLRRFYLDAVRQSGPDPPPTGERWICTPAEANVIARGLRVALLDTTALGDDRPAVAQLARDLERWLAGLRARRFE